MREIWKKIPGMLPRYEVSNLARVRSLRGPLPRLLSTLANKGYPTAKVIRLDGSKGTFGVHRLMLLAFRGEPRDMRMHAAHLDGNPRNCRLNNLAWATCRENHAHRLRHGTHQLGENNHRARLTAAQVRFIRKSHALGTVLATKYKVSPANICLIRRRKNWKHL